MERSFLREYPHHEIGAHLFGTVGEVTKEQLDDQRYRGVELGDRVGQSGVEDQYDRFLRGQNGANRVQVNALGNISRTLRESEPQQGRKLRLSVDLDVQRSARRRSRRDRPGAFAVMNVNNGEVVALGSSPSFDPNIFAKIYAARLRAVLEENGKPLSNRAIQGGYPTGSTFKLDHRRGRARGRPDHARHRAGRRRLAHGRPQ